jgi:hypothetical protein
VSAKGGSKIAYRLNFLKNALPPSRQKTYVAKKEVFLKISQLKISENIKLKAKI